MSLQYRGDEADHRLPGALQGGAAVPGGVAETGARAHVAEEDVAHLTVQFLVVHQQFALEIVLETPEVKVCRAGGHQVVVYYHGLGMEHAGIVQIHLDAGLQALRHVRERGILQHPAVARPALRNTNDRLSHWLIGPEVTSCIPTPDRMRAGSIFGNSNGRGCFR